MISFQKLKAARQDVAAVVENDYNYSLSTAI